MREKFSDDFVYQHLWSNDDEDDDDIDVNVDDDGGGGGEDTDDNWQLSNYRPLDYFWITYYLTKLSNYQITRPLDNL